MNRGSDCSIAKSNAQCILALKDRSKTGQSECCNPAYRNVTPMKIRNGKSKLIESIEESVCLMPEYRSIHPLSGP